MTLRVWNIDTGGCLHVLVGHSAAVRCVQYDGRLVVSGAYDSTVKVWDPQNETCLHTLAGDDGHTNRVYSLQVNRDNFFIFTVLNLYNCLYVWQYGLSFLMVNPFICDFNIEQANSGI